MPIPPEVVKCLRYVDARKDEHIRELRKLVEIPNVSTNAEGCTHTSAVIKWLRVRLKKLGFLVRLEALKADDRTKEVNLPPLVLATLGSDSSKKTLLYYCHLDVAPVQKEKWISDPFQLTEKEEKLYGRGAAKSKGPLLCFIHALECYIDLGIELPVNIKIIAESMSESKSEGLLGTLRYIKTSFLSNIDCVLVTDRKWIGRNCPCIIYGLRGACHFHLTIEGASQRLNSGDFGGIVQEPMSDLLRVLNGLVDHYGRMKIPHFYDNVAQVTPDEEDIYRKLKVDMEEYRRDVGVDKLAHDGQPTLTLMHVWRYPSFNMHSIDTATRCECQLDLDIPEKVFAHFSICTVPHQKHAKVCPLTIGYIEELLKKIKTPNKFKIEVKDTSDPWYGDYSHWNYEAAKTATKQVFKEEANLIREGSGFSSLLTLHEILPSKNILLMPLANSESNIHRENENISVRCYTEGTKLIASYLYQLKICAQNYDSEKKLSSRRSVCKQ